MKVRMLDICDDSHAALRSLQPSELRFVTTFEGVQDDFEGGALLLYTCHVCKSTFAVQAPKAVAA